MGLLDDIAAVERQPPTLEKWLETASDQERDAVLEFVRDRSVSIDTVARVLRKNGIRIGDATIKAYRESA